MITLHRFRRIEAAVRAAGYGETIDWAENLGPPRDADTFASEAIFVICSAGMAYAAARTIYKRCMGALRAEQPAAIVFGHRGKATAIDTIWAEREALFAAFLNADDQLAFIAELPWIGPITKYHLAKNLGADVAKPDVHLARLATRDDVSSQQLCERLAKLTGYRVATVDTILWRACADGIFDSAQYAARGWRGAFVGNDE